MLTAASGYAAGSPAHAIIEVAARNHVLKRLGRHSAREVAARLDGEIARRRRRVGSDEPASGEVRPAKLVGSAPGEGSCTS